MFLQTHQTVEIKCVSLTYVNYSAVKLIQTNEAQGVLQLPVQVLRHPGPGSGGAEAQCCRPREEEEVGPPLDHGDPPSQAQIPAAPTAPRSLDPGMVLGSDRWSASGQPDSRLVLFPSGAWWDGHTRPDAVSCPLIPLSFPPFQQEHHFCW